MSKSKKKIKILLKEDEIEISDIRQAIFYDKYTVNEKKSNKNRSHPPF